METTIPQDLIVSGSGSASGGVFRVIRVNGNAHLNGDFECRTLQINGRADLSGSARAKEVQVHGSSRINGGLKTENLQVHGYTTVGRHLSAGEVGVHGRLIVSGGVSCSNLESSGEMVVEGDCSAEMCRVRGGISVNGLLNAGNIDIQLFGFSRVGEIGGESVRVQRPGNFVSWFKRLLVGPFRKFQAQLEADTIEGDDIRLEYTTAKVVRGKRILIGPGCQIGRIEYLDHLEVEGNSKIGEQEKV